MKDQNYKSLIATFLKCNANQVFLYWKGRVALFAILKAMGIKEGDEVILPAFTCVVVPNAILYLKAKPVYLDISADNYNMNIDLLEESITNKTKVILCQNTFGLSSNIEEILQIAKRYKLYTIEDCTHGFGGEYNGKPNGSYCDAAFYSTQWNKPFSTGIGGFLLVNNDKLINPVRLLENKKVTPTLGEKITLSSLLLLNKYLINRFTYWTLLKLYRFLSKRNWIIGSNRGEELSEVNMPYNFFKGITSVQINAGIKELSLVHSVNILRRKNSKDYTKFLISKNKTYVDENLVQNHLFLKYPLMVRDRELIFHLAEKEKINLGDWFLSPLHPVTENLEQWGLKRELFPVADQISKKILNLPTDVSNNNRVINFLKKHIELIE
ncbi:MAG: aminotransferase class I/II-fold pyridoxal phosphate-dependent enzyme [Ignavibacteria bacterium]|nr:aminotransferase class I/II-fold pyridoxal phosphate-dependent enzyme [Ignavibacteria bacterium]MBT8392195.1 aminotransferase class I/II-fold pyridoxal phosphate-dependent enzyme [Ignavibacteria bacterium]NNL20079.1 aminotransferase class I/II-fold pyridoxal phosphate-dependent enzyme [Ignavibacteriaceae bacterium]